MSAKPPCVIVDGYSAGNLLPPEFSGRGHSSVHVQSTPVIWPILTLTYKPDDYTHHYAFDGDFDKLVSQLTPHRPCCVVPGTETGVPLADQLSEALDLPTNGTRLSRARRDKYEMIRRVGATGLAVARQHRAESKAGVLDWLRESRPGRVVVKPLESAGTDSVFICDSEAQVGQACDAILGTTNQLGIPNDAVLCQEFLSGTEYALDAVSMDGQAHFTAIWRYHKLTLNGVPFVYDHDELVPCTDGTGRALTDYVRRVLASLGIVQGPSHAEVMMTAGGPMLIEIGTRLNGITTPPLHARCVGYGQLDLTADAYLDPDRFRAKASKPYELKEYALSLSLNSEIAGVVKSVPGEALVRSLASFEGCRFRAKPGYQLKRTIDFYTHPGFATLVHADQDVLRADLAQLRAWEREGRMYELETGDA